MNENKMMFRDYNCDLLYVKYILFGQQTKNVLQMIVIDSL